MVLFGSALCSVCVGLCAQPGVLRYQVRLCASGEHGLSLTTGRTWANGSSTCLGLLVLATPDRYSLY